MALLDVSIKLYFCRTLEEELWTHTNLNHKRYDGERPYLTLDMNLVVSRVTASAVSKHEDVVRELLDNTLEDGITQS